MRVCEASKHADVLGTDSRKPQEKGEDLRAYSAVDTGAERGRGTCGDGVAAPAREAVVLDEDIAISHYTADRVALGRVDEA